MENNENQIQENVVEETVPSEIAINNDDKKIKTSKKKKIIIIVLILVLLIAGGIFAYFKFLKNDNSNTNYFDIYRSTFKTNDGIKLNFYTVSDDVVEKEARNIYKNRYSKICQNKDKNYNLEYCNTFENDSFKTFDYYYNIFSIKDNYLETYSKYSKIADSYNAQNYQSYLHSWAKFDDKIIGIFDFNFNVNYGVFAGNDITKEAQYPYEYYFLLDYNTGKVIQYNEEIYLITHTVYDKEYQQGTDLGTSFFAKKDKTSPRYKIYTTDFKYLGDSLSSPYNLTDDNGYVYAINDDIISKYDEKGNKKESLRDIKNIVDFAVFQNNCLALIYENNKLYLYDFSDNNKTQLKIYTGYNPKQNITDHFFFYYNDKDMLNNEVVIYGISNGDNTITTSIGEFAIYDYANKSLKMTYGSDVYSNGKITVELEEYDSKTDESGTVTKYYYLYFNNKKINVESYQYYDKNSDVLIVSNDHNVYILNTKTKKIITYYTSNKKLTINTEGSYQYNDWYEIFENSIYDDGKLVVVANKDNGEIVRLSSEIAKGVNVVDDELYIGYDKKIVKYSKTGEVLETLTFDELLIPDYSTLVGALIGDVAIRKGNDYYLLNISESKLSLYKLEKSVLYSGDNNTIYTYKYKDRLFMIADNELTEINEKPEKEDDNYAVYSRTGGMCNGNIFIDKKAAKITHTTDYMDFIKTINGYYFYDSQCVTDWGIKYVYTSAWEKIGIVFTSDDGIDDNGNVFVTSNGYIELRNINGELIEKSKEYKEIGGGLYKDSVLYVVLRENNKAYLVTLNQKLEETSKIEITTTKYDTFFPYLEFENGKIKIPIMNDDGEEIYFAYDISSKKIEKADNNN